MPFCKPCTCVSTSREGRGCTPRSGVSACRGDRGCTLRSCFSACRGGRGCTPCSYLSACREGRGCTPRNCTLPCRMDTDCTPRRGLSPSRVSIASVPSQYAFCRNSSSPLSISRHRQKCISIESPTSGAGPILTNPRGKRTLVSDDGKEREIHLCYTGGLLGQLQVLLATASWCCWCPCNLYHDFF